MPGGTRSRLTALIETAVAITHNRDLLIASVRLSVVRARVCACVCVCMCIARIYRVRKVERVPQLKSNRVTSGKRARARARLNHQNVKAAARHTQCVTSLDETGIHLLMNVVYGIVCELNVLELHTSSGCWLHSDSCISITCSSLLWNMMHTYPFLLKRNVHRCQVTSETFDSARILNLRRAV